MKIIDKVTASHSMNARVTDTAYIVFVRCFPPALGQRFNRNVMPVFVPMGQGDWPKIMQPQTYT